MCNVPTSIIMRPKRPGDKQNEKDRFHEMVYTTIKTNKIASHVKRQLWNSNTNLIIDACYLISENHNMSCLKVILVVEGVHKCT